MYQNKRIEASLIVLSGGQQRECRLPAAEHLRLSFAPRDPHIPPPPSCFSVSARDRRTSGRRSLKLLLARQKILECLRSNTAGARGLLHLHRYYRVKPSRAFIYKYIYTQSAHTRLECNFKKLSSSIAPLFFPQRTTFL